MKLELSPGPIASQFIRAVATGQGDEVLALGPRGEAKTTSALIAMGYHAKLHEQANFKLPVTWMGVTDTFNAHKEKTIDTLKRDLWQGAWRIEDGGHKAIFHTNKDAVLLSLFGIEDAAALDRVRKETCCAWYEEVAPTTEGAGVPEEAVDIGITSQRVPTHAAVTMLTSNYPDDGHWLWKRFKPIMGSYGLNVHPDDPRKLTFQIPKGDNKYITAAMRARWLERLKDRPDLVQRLLEGKPAIIHRGQAVAQAFMGTQPIGYNEARHLSPIRLRVTKDVPIILGQDGGHTPATVGMQEVNGVVRVLFSLCINRGGMRQQYKHNVVPWLRRYAPWALEDPDEYILGGYDPSLPDDESDTERQDKNPIDVIEDEIQGAWIPGPVDWESRKGAMFALFNRSVGGDPGVLIDPIECEGLLRALRGQWYYQTDRFGNVTGDKPKSPNHPHEDYGQAFCYAACRLTTYVQDDGSDDMSQHKSEYDPLTSRE
jgi:hypothetical protein